MTELAQLPTALRLFPNELPRIMDLYNKETGSKNAGRKVNAMNDFRRRFFGSMGPRPLVSPALGFVA